MEETKDLVKVSKGKILCDSRKIAEKFGKHHVHVLQKIDKTKKECVEIDGNLVNEKPFAKKNIPTEIFKEKTREYRGQTFRYYELNRHAFSLVAMSFTGKKALVWRRLFNNAFYLMEEQLLRQSNLEWKQSREQGKQIRLALTDEIKTFVDYATAQGSKNAGMYYANISKMQNKALGLIEKNEKVDKNFRNTLDEMDLHNLIAAEIQALKALAEGMAKELHYKDIYQLAKARVLDLAAIMMIDTPKLDG